MGLDEIPLLDSHGEIVRTKTFLPHWQQEYRTYFVTFRLADSLPRTVLDQWTEERLAWLGVNPEPWTAEVERQYHARFSARTEEWLDAGHGDCILRCPTNSEIVATALAFFEGQRCTQISWVVMPNHVHALFTLHKSHALDKLIRSWKIYTSREINRATERSGALWQRDYFDRLIRDERHLINCTRYIRRNPEKARLVKGEYLLWESAISKGIE